MHHLQSLKSVLIYYIAKFCAQNLNLTYLANIYIANLISLQFVNSMELFKVNIQNGCVVNHECFLFQARFTLMLQ